MDDVQRMLTDIRFYDQVHGDAKRTIICPPHLVSAVQAVVDQHHAEDLYTVRASRACALDRLIIIDEQAIEADTRQAAQRPIRFREE